MKITRWIWKFKGKYFPTQGKHEKLRRVNQIAKGMLKKENGLK